jgi:molybdenum cofactor cytidylyltransferase
MIAIVILAAGSSSRMGRAKQNLLFGDKTLLQHTIIEAKKVTDQVIVTVGAAKEKILPTLKDLNIEILENKNWDAGMSTSVTLAVKHLLGSSNKINGIIFLLCDQPYIGTGLLNELINVAGNSEKAIIASTYDGTVGVPVYFKNRFFPELLKLKGKEGAKKLIEQFSNDVQTIPFPLGSIDIDTPEDFQKLFS